MHLNKEDDLYNVYNYSLWLDIQILLKTPLAVIRAADKRCIQMSFRLKQMRERARGNLLSDQGEVLRSRRSIEPESVFGQIKHNWGFRRFLLRGKEKVEVEWSLLCCAHNIAKMAN